MDKGYYKEEDGTIESDPKLNTLIRREFRLSLEIGPVARCLEGTIDLNILTKAARAVLLRAPLEGNSPREIRGRLSRVRDTGWGVQSYSRLNSHDLRRYFTAVKNQIVDTLRRELPRELESIRSENSRRAQEAYQF